MSQRWSWWAIVIVVVLMLNAISISTPSSARATSVDTTYVEGTDQQAFLFNPLFVNTFNLHMDQSSIDALNNDPRSYAPATLTVTTQHGTSSTYNVGVHIKGMWGSYRDLNGKTGFKIKMNFSVPGQSFYGIKKFTLNNMVQDNSMLHEATTYRLFRAMGVAAPRVGYAEVYLNGQDYGLHADIETYDKPMLSRWFANGTTHLYEYGYGHEVGVDGDPQYMSADEGDPLNESDVANVETINNTYTGSDWFNAIQPYVDINEMIMDWALEHYVGQWDGYTRGWPNNYYVHFDKNNVATMHPWGMDQSLVSWNAFIDDGATMMTRCVYYQPCRDLYTAALVAISQKEPTLHLEQMVDKIWAVTGPYVQSDPRKEDGFDSATQAMQDTKTFLTNRRAELISYLGADQTASRLSVTYPTAGYAVDKTMRPNLSTNSDGIISYTRLNGDGVCDVNSITGAMTVHLPGTCRIAVSMAASSTHYARMVIVSREIPMMATRVIITGASNLARGHSTVLQVTKDSTGVTSLHYLSGACRVSGLRVTATGSSGHCWVRISVAGDHTFLSATRSWQIRLHR